MLKDAPILILDEATSSVDPETEQALSEALRRVAAGRTLVSIAHRLSTAEQADLVLVFDQGRIVASGTHEELLHSSELYARLARLQFREAAVQPPAVTGQEEDALSGPGSAAAHDPVAPG